MISEVDNLAACNQLYGNYDLSIARQTINKLWLNYKLRLAHEQAHWETFMVVFSHLSKKDDQKLGSKMKD